MSVPHGGGPPEAQTPKADRRAFPIVGIGASAGGLAAFEAFFSGMPADADPGMAFVLVQHLAPDRKSMLAELVRHDTRMMVFEVEDGMVMAQVIAAGALVNGAGDIHYLHGRTGMFLAPGPGEAEVNNILTMAREGPRPELAASLRRAVHTPEAVASPGLRARTNGHVTTVNTELQTKVTDLARANNDMNKLLAGTGIGTVFVDHPLRIQPHRTLDKVTEGVVISHVDVTERKKIQDSLLRTAELLEPTGALARVGGWDLEVSSMALSWTPKSFRVHDLDPSCPPSLSQAVAFYDPQAQPVAQAGLQAAIDQGTAWSFELPLTAAKGRAIWVRAQGVAEVHNGKSVRLFGAIQDITGRKQVEEAQRLASERLLAAERDRP